MKENLINFDLDVQNHMKDFPEDEDNVVLYLRGEIENNEMTVTAWDCGTEYNIAQLIKGRTERTPEFLDTILKLCAELTARNPKNRATLKKYQHMIIQEALIDFNE